ncbi:MAG TPA: LLM class flavin-dependent oxidoreductase [Candidatus Binatia bacterium]|jgi:alkanesulfonate monooxygenase SsuD/methylene tetrahydromethanopterin reductase-like flavin-dependent oxidoreductase (luciferase family)|nr:LLM class flavin-dependent oxidoreductase [Candidatus Binatia bacterium]
MDFGILVECNPDAPAIAKLAEANGFKSFFIIDSHVGWREVYPYLTLCARETSRIRIGTLVTNPVTRHPTVTASAFATLNEISNGRMVLGIAKGDSATRVIGERQATMAEFRNGVRLIQRLMNGETVEYTPKTPDKAKWLAQAGGKPIETRFHWYEPPGRIPTYIGGYGPKTLHFAGEGADAVVIQAPHPSAVQWSLGHAFEGAKGAGRDPKTLRIVVSGPIGVNDDMKKATDDLRWFVQAVWNHSAHLLEHYQKSELPEALVTGLPADFHSDYSEHIVRDAEELKQVPDRAVDLLTVIGPADRCVERLEQLAAMGASEFIHYALGALSKAEIDESIRTIGKHIIPRMQ